MSRFPLRRLGLRPAMLALLLFPVLAFPASAQDEGPSLGVVAEIGFEGREESGPGAGISQRPDENFEVKIEPTLSYRGLNLTGLLFTTSLEEAKRQARNRFRLQTEHEYVGLTVGDAYNSGSEFVARGARIRGVGGYLRYNPHEITVYRGETRRDVEGAYDSTLARVRSFGTYRRTVTNANLELQPVAALTVRLSVADGEDETASIDVGRRPKENTALGGDASYALFRGRAEVFASAGRSETEELATTFDSTATKHDDEWAWKAGAKGRVGEHHLAGSYSSIGTNYESFGAPSLTSDRAGFELEDRFALVGSKLRVVIGFDSRHDNVDDLEDFTLTANRFSGSFTYRPPGNALHGDLRASYRVSSNDAPDSLSARVDNKVADVSVGIGKAFSAGRGVIHPRLSFRNSRRSDDARPTSEYTRRTYGGKLDARWPRYRGGANLTISATDYDPEERTDRNQLDLRLDHALEVTPRLELRADQIFSRTTADGGVQGRRFEVGGRLLYEVVARRVAVEGSYNYIDFASDTNEDRDFTGHEFSLRLKTVGSVALVD